MAMAPVQRTSQGLVNALFDCIDKLNSKEITAEDARAVSHTVRSIVQIARLEMEFRGFADAAGEKAKIVSLAIDKK
jgi:hypothetical protein